PELLLIPTRPAGLPPGIRHPAGPDRVPAGCGRSPVQRRHATHLHWRPVSHQPLRAGLRVHLPVPERAVPLLVHLLGQGDDRVLFYSITCLRAILLCVEEARAELRACDGVVVITRLLRHGDIRFLALLVDCLQLVAFGNEETKLLILKSGGTVELVDILRRAQL
ncbi:hypothetical protein BOX15_Mlig026881g2, partial [Macrostomum lignano]